MRGFRQSLGEFFKDKEFPNVVKEVAISPLTVGVLIRIVNQWMGEAKFFVKDVAQAKHVVGLIDWGHFDVTVNNIRKFLEEPS